MLAGAVGVLMVIFLYTAAPTMVVRAGVVAVAPEVVALEVVKASPPPQGQLTRVEEVALMLLTIRQEVQGAQGL
jgi:hypothetical protein